MARRDREQGLTLIELMVSIVIGLLVMAGVVQVFVSTVAGSRDLLEQSRLEHELNAILLWMSDDIRRAGYWGLEAQAVDWGEGDRNPFMEGNRRLNVAQKTGETASSCILYTYNLDGDADTSDDAADDARVGVCNGCVPSAAPFTDTTIYDYDNLEMFGYRLSGGQVEMRSGLATMADSTFSCDAGGWEALSDGSTVTITGLSFTLSTQNIATLTATSAAGVDTTLQVESWRVDIQLSGQLAADAGQQKTLSTSVKLANNVIRE